MKPFWIIDGYSQKLTFYGKINDRYSFFLSKLAEKIYSKYLSSLVASREWASVGWRLTRNVLCGGAEIWVLGWQAGCCGLSPASPRILWRTETEIWGWPSSSQWTLGLRGWACQAVSDQTCPRGPGWCRHCQPDSSWHNCDNVSSEWAGVSREYTRLCHSSVFQFLSTTI